MIRFGVLAAVLLFACSSEPIQVDASVDAGAIADGGSDAGAGMTEDEFYTHLLRYRCRTLQNCSSASAQSAADQLAYADVDECVAARGPLGHLRVPVDPEPIPPEYAADSDFDPVAAAECAAILATIDECYRSDNAMSILPECRAVWTGNGVAEAPCRFGLEDCAPDLFCDVGTTISPCGRCRPKLGPGGTCGSNPTACIEPADADSVCYRNRCENARYEWGAAEGAACGLVRIDPLGALYVRCAPDLFCDDGGAGEGGSCVPRVAIGETCTERSVCVRGAVCAAARCTEVRFAELGGPCGAESPCNFREREVCVDGTCAALGDGSEGSYCTTRATPSIPLCGEGLACGASNRCAPAMTTGLPNGAPCAISFECASGYCAPETSACADPKCL